MRYLSPDVKIYNFHFRINRGFTLVEILLVITIMLTLSVPTAAFYGRFLTQNAVSNTVDQIAGSLRKAQTYAMAGKNGSSNWGVNFGAKTITLYSGNSYVTRTPALDEKFSVNTNVSVVGLTDLNFTRVTGIPASSPTITVSGGNTSKTISINSQGVVSR